MRVKRVDEKIFCASLACKRTSVTDSDGQAQTSPSSLINLNADIACWEVFLVIDSECLSIIGDVSCLPLSVCLPEIIKSIRRTK